MCDEPPRAGMPLVVAACCALVTLASGCYVFPSDVPDPCAGVACGPGAACRASADGRAHRCECPAACPSYGDHDGARPACGSDARDYPGECQMRRAACEANKNITIKYYGKCDPCAGVTCPDPEVCQLDERRAAACRCAEACSLEFSPVCASDGKTYSNECQMNRESCRARKQLRIIFKGQCSSGTNPCAQVQCRHGAECRVDGGGAVCACAAPCERVLRPVCGSDGATHDSDCELRRAACLLGREIAVVHAGECGSSGVCTGRACPFGGECVPAHGRGACRCPRCSHEFAPVCGSDGISYGNRCKLQLEACRHRREVTVLYDGACNGCENKKCEFYAVCESDGVSEASCVCPKHCEEGTETEEVCGSDNSTYSSVCALRDAACRERRPLHVKHMGSCESCLAVICPPDTWCSRGACSCATPCAYPPTPATPVCSSAGVTYPHACALRRAACEARERGELIELAREGECDAAPNTTSTADIAPPDDNTTAACARVACSHSATCTLAGGGARCTCAFDCAAAAPAPVCASDYRLYPTLCHLKLEACRRQQDLRLRPLAVCQGLEVRPCGDDDPLSDADGAPLDCGGGPHRKDCPAGSYCHHTHKAARCCPKVSPEKAVQVSPAPCGRHGCCPESAGCHRLGALGCDAGRCTCRPGVGGDRCDRCLHGYWGLSKVGAVHKGCIPCGCSAFGSVREDCEQMTGRCVCRPGLQGQKCTVCADHEHVLGPRGCYDPESTQLPATSCEHMTCYFGATCTLRGGLAACECRAPPCGPGAPACGSDGRTYASPCELRAHACRTQADVVLQALGPCASPRVHRDNVTAHCGDCVRTEASEVAESDYSSYEDYLDEKNKDNEFYRVPLFDGEASMTARTRLPAKRFDILAEVSAVCGDGALLSAVGSKDHLWLGFVDNKAVVRWDAGSGPFDLRTGSVKTDGRVKLSARKYRRDAVLRLGGAAATGSARGRMTSLDVDPFLYLGQPPENVSRLTGNKALGGFVGCIHRLRVSGRDVIPPSRGLSVRAAGLKPCTPHNLAKLVCP